MSESCCFIYQAHADKEQAQFEQEWRELGRVLEQDRKLREKMVGQDRGRTTSDEDNALRKSSNKGTWNVAKDKAAQKASLDRVQSLEEAVQQIKAATGIDNIDELVQTFIDAEDQNFSLFNYVNELNNEVEKLEEQIADIKAEIEKYKGQGGQNDRQRKKLLKDLEDRLASTEARAEQYEAKALKAAKTVSQLEQGIQSIFSKIGCDKSAISDMLGTTGVTESNMMQYLGIIEQVPKFCRCRRRARSWPRRRCHGPLQQLLSTPPQSPRPSSEPSPLTHTSPPAHTQTRARIRTLRARVLRRGPSSTQTRTARHAAATPTGRPAACAFRRNSPLLLARAPAL